MVSVAQLVERWIVAPVVEGSSPFTHPINLVVNHNSALHRKGNLLEAKAYPIWCISRSAVLGHRLPS